MHILILLLDKVEKFKRLLTIIDVSQLKDKKHLIEVKVVDFRELR